jgi:hypothetical protein
VLLLAALKPAEQSSASKMGYFGDVFFFTWVTPLARKGHQQHQLQYEDLLPVPSNATPKTCTTELWMEWTHVSFLQQQHAACILIRAISGVVPVRRHVSAANRRC